MMRTFDIAPHKCKANSEALAKQSAERLSESGGI